MYTSSHRQHPQTHPTSPERTTDVATDEHNVFQHVNWHDWVYQVRQTKINETSEGYDKVGDQLLEVASKRAVKYLRISNLANIPLFMLLSSRSTQLHQISTILKRVGELGSGLQENALTYTKTDKEENWRTVNRTLKMN